jgi:hypothetical protein
MHALKAERCNHISSYSFMNNMKRNSHMLFLQYHIRVRIILNNTKIVTEKCVGAVTSEGMGMPRHYEL